MARVMEPDETRHSELVIDETSASGRAFRFAEKALLAGIAIMTLIATGAEVWAVAQRGAITLADILLMFIYTEVIGMIAIFFRGTGPVFAYPIFIAITALARLVVLQGKDMAPENLIYEAAAILLMSIAALLILRSQRA
jgi:protein PsiE